MLDGLYRIGVPDEKMSREMVLEVLINEVAFIAIDFRDGVLSEAEARYALSRSIEALDALKVPTPGGVKA